MKIDETKLKISSVRAKDRHSRQAEVEDEKWHGINEARKADQLAAAHAAEAATAKAKLKVSQDESRAAAKEAIKADAERAEAIAATEAATARVEQAERNAKAAADVATHARAEADAAIAAAKRADAAQAKAFTGVRKLREMVNKEPTVASIGEPGLTKMEKKIRMIDAAAKGLGYDVMCIPTGGKKILARQCMASHGSMFSSESQFNDAWKEARAQKRVRTERNDDYANHKEK